MDYQDTLSYLYHRLPLFQNQGQGAYKEGLANTQCLDAHFGHPHRKYDTIHVAGTNGKGSCSHTLAAILQCAGYKVGLYTSPHLVDFRERIRINGKPVSEKFIVDFVAKERAFFEPLQASFFEVTTAMALYYFARQKVDVAVIETGLGGRLDCTNVITPKLSLITNISLDHTALLGDSLPQIAYEKAGIIKENIPVVIGEATDETRPVFEKAARKMHAPLVFAEDNPLLISAHPAKSGGWACEALSPFSPGDRILIYDNPYLSQQPGFPDNLTFHAALGGYAQVKNINTVLLAVQQLYQSGFALNDTPLKEGFAHVSRLTGLRGRWEKLSDNPPLYCDTGHNAGGMSYLAEQLSQQQYETLRMVIGVVNDKDIRGILEMLPRDARYYFTQAHVARALPAIELQAVAESVGLKGTVFSDVQSAVQAAKQDASPRDFVFVGGSTFVVADLLSES